MLASQIPTKFGIPFASSAGGAYSRPVPDASQIGIQAGAASNTDGFPPVTFIPESAGGTPPFGQDFNGLLNQVTKWARWQAAGGPVPYDSAFQAAIGGYPLGATVAALTFGYVWLSTTDGNATNPETGGAGWQQISLIGFSTGDVKPTFKAAADLGWVMMNDGTIGDASSGGSTRANADCLSLFTVMWNNVTNAWAPVSGGRGANAAADFAAHKTLALPKALGQAFASAGAGAGLTSRALGSNVGEETHILTTPQMPAHTHTASNIPTDISFVFGNVPSGAVGWVNPPLTTITTSSTGGGAAHNNLQPTTFVNWMVRL